MLPWEGVGGGMRRFNVDDVVEVTLYGKVEADNPDTESCSVLLLDKGRTRTRTRIYVDVLWENIQLLAPAQMTFEKALEALRKGLAVRRTSWPKDLAFCLQKPKPNVWRTVKYHQTYTYRLLLDDINATDWVVLNER